MPIYEFICDHCAARFEELVRDGELVVCPGCSSSDVRRVLSAFAVHSSSPGFAGVASGSAGKSCTSCSSSSCATCH
jgi:putative FmdB family regulatory protein